MFPTTKSPSVILYGLVSRDACIILWLHTLGPATLTFDQQLHHLISLILISNYTHIVGKMQQIKMLYPHWQLEVHERRDRHPILSSSFFIWRIKPYLMAMDAWMSSYTSRMKSSPLPCGASSADTGVEMYTVQRGFSCAQCN